MKIKNLIEKNLIFSALVFLLTLLLTQTYISNFYNITASPDFIRYYDYFLYFNGSRETTGLEQGLIYYYICFLVFSKNSTNLNLYNFEELISVSVLEANFYFYLITLFGLYKLLTFSGYKLKDIFIVFSILNFFPPGLVLRIIFKPEVIITTLFIWIIFFIKKYLTYRKSIYGLFLALSFTLIASIKISSTLIVLFALITIFKRELLHVILNKYFVALSFLLYILVSYENFTANGLLLFQHQTPIGYQNNAPLSFIYNFNINNLIVAPVRNEHANSLVSIILLDTFDDYFRLFWMNDKSVFSINRVNFVHPYLRQYIGIFISFIFYFTLIIKYFLKSKEKEYTILPFLGILFMVTVSLTIQFDPTSGDMLKNYYFGFLLVVAFVFILIEINSFKKKLVVLILFAPIMIFIFGFPKTQDNLIMEKVSLQNQFSITCAIGKVVDKNVSSDCYNFDIDYCLNQFTKNNKIIFSNGEITTISTKNYKEIVTKLYELREVNFPADRQSCLNSDNNFKNVKFVTKSRLPFVNLGLFISFFFGALYNPRSTRRDKI